MALIAYDGGATELRRKLDDPATGRLLDRPSPDNSQHEGVFDAVEFCKPQHPLRP